RKRFEAGFLASPRGRRKLELAKSLMLVASARKPAAQPKAALFFSMRWAFAAAALLLLFVLGWSIRQKMRQRPPAQSAGGRHNETNHQPPAVSSGQADQTPARAEGPSEHPQTPVLASIILRPVARNIEQSPRVKVPRGVQMKIQLDLEADNHKSY